MSKKKIEYCKVCNEKTTHMYKTKVKIKKKNLNLKYCMKCKTGYKNQLVGCVKSNNAK